MMLNNVQMKKGDLVSWHSSRDATASKNLTHLALKSEARNDANFPPNVQSIILILLGSAVGGCWGHVGLISGHVGPISGHVGHGCIFF